MRLNEVVGQHMITDLLQLCKHELHLDELPEINIINDQPTIAAGTSFGQFDKNGINVVSKDRHPMDIMRTLAHELVHWSQSVNGRELDGSDGSDIENEANAVAGKILRKFGRAHPEYYIDSNDRHPSAAG